MTGRQSRQGNGRGGVSEDLHRARGLVAYIDLLLDSEQDGSFRGHVFDPSSYIPSEEAEALLTSAPEPTPSPIPAPAPQVTAEVINEQIKPVVTEPAVEAEPALIPEPESTQAEVIDLPALAREPTHVDAPALDAGANEDEEINHGELLDQLIAYARELIDRAPLEGGVQSMALRGQVKKLERVLPTLIAVRERTLTGAKDALSTEHHDLAQLIALADTQIAQAVQEGAAPDVDAAILTRAQGQITKLLAEGEEIRRGIFRCYVEIATAAGQLHTVQQEVDRHGAHLAAAVQSMTTPVSYIQLYGQRSIDTAHPEQQEAQQEVAHATEQLVKARKDLETHKASILAQQTKAEPIVNDIRTITSRAKVLETGIERWRNGYRSLRSMLERLNVPVPDDLRRQFEMVLERITQAHHEWQGARTGATIPVPEEPMDPWLTKANGYQKTVREATEPPKTSNVFKQRLSRDAQLRQLTLINAFTLTPEKNLKGGRTKVHDGLVLRSFLEILLQSELIEPREVVICLAHIKAMKDLKRDPLMETHGQATGSRRWRYRPTEKGLLQATTWLRDCHEPDKITESIRSAQLRIRAMDRQELKTWRETHDLSKL